MKTTFLTLILALAWLLQSSSCLALTPWLADVAYGDKPAQKFDLYKPQGAGPFPVLMYIHAGGWQSGDKKWFMGDPDINRFLDAGIAVVSINYRFLGEAAKDGLFPPVLGPFHDARRALQTLRHRAKEWALDPANIAVAGSSAGACTALWLALSPETADPQAADPVARMSTRVVAAGTHGAQTSLDPAQIRQWNPETAYGARAFGLWDVTKEQFEAFLKKRPEFEKYFATVSPAALLSPDDPPIFLAYGSALDEPKKDANYYIHSPAWGIGFEKLAKEKGVVCHLAYKGHPAEGYENRDLFDFLIERLKVAAAGASRRSAP
ncbi:MAG: alpha/beta hydrolase [Lentisphaeria bacterium]|jgi:acetyl esterase/lipase